MQTLFEKRKTQKPHASHDPTMRVYLKQKRRFIVRDAMLAVECHGGLLDVFNREREPLWGPEITPPKLVSPLKRSSPSSASLRDLYSPESASSPGGLEAEQSPAVLEQAKVGYGSPVMLPPFQSMPYLPPSLRLRSTFYSSPELSLKFNPHLAEQPVVTHWGESSSSQRLLQHSEAWAQKQRALHARREASAENEALLAEQAAFALPHSSLARALDRLDLLLTIAHCSRCHQHISLRHDCEWYQMRASELLVTLGEVICHYNPEARVGLLRLKRCEHDPRKVARAASKASPAIVRQTKLSELQREHSSKRLGEQRQREKVHEEATPVPRLKEAATAGHRPPSSMKRLPKPVFPASSSPAAARPESGGGDDDSIDAAAAAAAAAGPNEALAEGERASLTSRRLRSTIPLGAFEVQVSFRRADGAILSRLLHSKLASRLWPSVSACSAALEDFLASHVTTLDKTGATPGDEEDAAEQRGSSDDTPHPEGAMPEHHGGRSNEAALPSQGSKQEELYGNQSTEPDAKEEDNNYCRPATQREPKSSAKPYCAYPSSCTRGCRERRTQTIVPLHEVSANPNTHIKPIKPKQGNSAPSHTLQSQRRSDTTLTWVLDKTDDVPLHDFAVGDVVDVLLVAPIVLSPRRRGRRQGDALQTDGRLAPPVATVPLSQFGADRRSVSTVTAVRPAIRKSILPRERSRDRDISVGVNDRGASPFLSRSSSPSASPSPWRPASAGRISPSPSPSPSPSIATRDKATVASRIPPAGMHASNPTLLWYEQGFLRGSVTSTHRDGTYDVAFWPSSEAAVGGSGSGSGRRVRGKAARRYIPVLSTDSSTHGGKTAIEGFLEKGIPAHYVRGLQGTSVLTQSSTPSADPHGYNNNNYSSSSNSNSNSSRRGNKKHSTMFPLHLCLSEDQLERTVRPWARHDETFVPQASEGNNGDDQQSDDGNFTEAEAEAEVEVEAEEAGLVDDLVDCPIADLELNAYAPIFL